MFSEAKTLEEALSEFERTRNAAPYRFSGRWFLVRVPGGFQAYRDKRSAAKASQRGEFYQVEL